MELADLFIVSEVNLMTGTPPADAKKGERAGLFLRVDKARGQRCDRCWNYRAEGEARAGGFVCTRCAAVLKALGNS